MSLLQIEAVRLKEKFGPKYHDVIDKNLKWVTKEMTAAPNSIGVQEGRIALSQGLPSESFGHSRSRRKSAGRKNQNFRKRL